MTPSDPGTLEIPLSSVSAYLVSLEFVSEQPAFAGITPPLTSSACQAETIAQNFARLIIMPVNVIVGISLRELKSEC
jgi:hypothetical protein